MKKTLSLVLALVMVFGLMAFPASADFTDSSAIEYTEAVDVMSACGIINGFENGSFDPAGNLTREQAAKVIAYMLLGEDVADAMTATSAPYADVAATRWSAGYIAYCANSGIVAGRDGKTFDPTGTVTGYEFAKMLLVALGYNSATEGFTGSSWAINVAKTALAIDLFDGNDGSNYNAPLTREQAALYAFNTLKATMVEYESTGTNIDLGNGIIITTGASKADEVADAGNKKDTIKTDALLQFAEKYFSDLEYTAADTDAFGRPATSWVYDGEDVGTYAEAADLTYTAAVKGSDIYKALDKPTVGTTVYTYFVDGASTAIADLKDAAGLTSVNNFKPASDESDKLGKNGVLMEFYERDVTDAEADDDYTVAYDVVIINTYVGEITDWTAADEDDDTDEFITISNISAKGADGDYETTVYTDDDADDNTVVLYTYADDEIQSVVSAESVTAFVSDSASDKFVAGGTTYKYSFNADGTAAYVKDADDTLIYLDTYGYAIYVTDVPDATDEYAYVLDTDESGMFSGTAYAKLLMPTGETLVVETEDLYDGSVGNGVDLRAKIVTYTVDDDDVYELAAAATAKYNTAGNGADVTIDTGKTALTLGASGVTYANSNTVFVVKTIDDGDTVYTAYTGYKSVTNLDADNNGVFAVIPNEDNSKLADLVYIMAATEDDSASADELTYVAIESKPANATTNSTGTYFTVNAVVEGSITTLKLDAKLFAAAVPSGNADDAGTPDVDESILTPAGTLYGKGDVLIDSMTTNSKGVVTAVTLTVGADFDTAIGTVAEDSGLVGLGTDFFTFDDDTVVYTVDEDGVIDASSIAAIDDDDYAVIYTVDEDDANLLVSVYITTVDVD